VKPDEMADYVREVANRFGPEIWPTDYRRLHNIADFLDECTTLLDLAGQSAVMADLDGSIGVEIGASLQRMHSIDIADEMDPDTRDLVRVLERAGFKLAAYIPPKTRRPPDKKRQKKPRRWWWR
jgi:hypothetical protein